MTNTDDMMMFERQRGFHDGRHGGPKKGYTGFYYLGYCAGAQEYERKKPLQDALVAKMPPLQSSVDLSYTPPKPLIIPPNPNNSSFIDSSEVLKRNYPLVKPFD